MAILSKVRHLFWLGLLMVLVSGCGSTQANPSPASQSTRVSTSHSKTAHKHRGVHIKGVVTTITPEQIVVKTKSGTVWTIAVSSHTHYRQKKVSIKSSAIVPGKTVVILARHKSSRYIARVIRLL